jgi:hypothetical protein
MLLARSMKDKHSHLMAQSGQYFGIVFPELLESLIVDLMCHRKWHGRLFSFYVPELFESLISNKL